VVAGRTTHLLRQHPSISASAVEVSAYPTLDGFALDSAAKVASDEAAYRKDRDDDMLPDQSISKRILPPQPVLAAIWSRLVNRKMRSNRF
jgi:hypothetical protein